jgi:hypothetical protein
MEDRGNSNRVHGFGHRFPAGYILWMNECDSAVTRHDSGVHRERILLPQQPPLASRSQVLPLPAEAAAEVATYGISS